MKNLHPFPQLATLLEERQTEIQTAWVDLLRDLSGSHYETTSDEQLSTWTVAGVTAIIESLRTGSKQPLIRHAGEFSGVLSQLGFAIDEVVEGLLLLREAALDHLLIARTQLTSEFQDPLRNFDAASRVLIARMVQLFAETIHEALTEEQDRGAPETGLDLRDAETHKLLIESQKLRKAAESLLEMQGFDHVLEIVCSEAEALARATGSALFLSEKGAVPALTFKHGQALSRGDDELVSGSETDRSLMRFPLAVRGHNLGSLVLVGQETGFDEEGIGLAARFADQAAIAIQHALLHRQHEKLVILEERQKLAHELHDSATQSIYGVTMYGEAAARLLESNQLEKASTILRELQETALDALREMRLLVFELRPPMLEKEGLAAALQARLSAVEGRAGLATEFSAAKMEALSSRVSEALYGIAKEALNNVLKHAGASRVAIRLQQLESAIALEIADDGAGFEPALASERGGLGLQGMKERAEGIGAHLSISSSPGKGTTIRVEAALRDTMEGSEGRKGML